MNIVLRPLFMYKSTVCISLLGVNIIMICMKMHHNPGVCIRSFIRSLRQESSLLWTPARRPSAGSMRLPQVERRGIGWCVQCVRDMQEWRVK